MRPGDRPRGGALPGAPGDRGPDPPRVTEYREPGEIASNPFWRAIHDDPTKARKGILRHNLAGSPGTEIVPALWASGDPVVRGKKRYSAFFATDLEFLLRRLGATTLILAGINTTTCILCTAFEATNRDFRVVIASDAVDSMDGEEMHGFALRLMGAAVGWVWGNEAILKALRR
ncbi:MAG: cysteine hydrolase [Candidatus Rokubacteria bacterium]|nr:cysteine hydrolase [Candidatus Rokubacteria bacterium]